MREFFKGWRRKMGCVMLVMALSVFGLWVRSHVVLDFCSFSTVGRRHEFGSLHGCLCWRSREESRRHAPAWLKLPSKILSSKGYLDLDPDIVAASDIRQWVMPQLLIVMVLTLLSACLILWKPRVRSAMAPQPEYPLREFFRGWRRMMGCVTLALTCVLCMGWVRSHVVWDVICFARGAREHVILAMDERLVWMSWELSELNTPVDMWQTIEAEEFDSTASELAGLRSLNSSSEWRLDWLPVVTSLTLLSACLILPKPRRVQSLSHEAEAAHA